VEDLFFEEGAGVVGVGLEDFLEEGIGGLGVALDETDKAGEVDAGIEWGLLGSDAEEENLLVEPTGEVIGREDKRAAPLWNNAIEEGAFAEGVAEGAGGAGAWMENVKEGLDKVFPSEKRNVGDAEFLEVFEGFGIGLGVEGGGSSFEALDVFPVESADGAEASEGGEEA
jgi:hypothetical protein